MVHTLPDQVSLNGDSAVTVLSCICGVSSMGMSLL